MSSGESRQMFQRIAELCLGNPRIAILMSGKGSNAKVILEQRFRYPNLDFATIMTDKVSSNAGLLARAFGLDYILVDDRSVANRAELFDKMRHELRQSHIQMLIYAGFMKITPATFLTEFPGINMHPADLTIHDEDGHPKYVGMHAVNDVIRDRQISIASTLHVVEEVADFGIPIAVSPRIPLSGMGSENPKEVHDAIKVHCEHKLYPFILELLATGKIAYENMPLHIERIG